MTEPEQTPDPGGELHVQLRRHDRTAVLEVAGEVDLLTANQFRTALREALTDPPYVLVVDLRELTFLGSIGLSHLLEANAAAGPDVLRLVPSRAARRTIEVAGMDRLLIVRETIDDALRVSL